MRSSPGSPPRYRRRGSRASPPACTCCCACRPGPTRPPWWPRSRAAGSVCAAWRATGSPRGAASRRSSSATGGSPRRPCPSPSRRSPLVVAVGDVLAALVPAGPPVEADLHGVVAGAAVDRGLALAVGDHDVGTGAAQHGVRAVAAEPDRVIAVAAVDEVPRRAALQVVAAAITGDLVATAAA